MLRFRHYYLQTIQTCSSVYTQCFHCAFQLRVDLQERNEALKREVIDLESERDQLYTEVTHILQAKPTPESSDGVI